MTLQRINHEIDRIMEELEIALIQGISEIENPADRAEAAERYATMMVAASPDFDRAAFLSACGVEEV